MSAGSLTVDDTDQSQQELLHELVERVETLEKEDAEKEARLNALNKKLTRLIAILVGDADDIVADEFDRSEDMWTRLGQIEEKAEEAIAVAQANQGPSGAAGTKKDHARTLSRNEVVVQAAVKGSSTHGSVTTTQVEDMAKPDVRLESRTILDAWDDLTDNWACFEIEEGTPGPHGDASRLKAESDGITTSLLRAVKNDLTDEEVNEALIMKIKSNGGA